MTRLLLFTALAGLAGCVPDGLTDFDFQGLQPDPPADERTGEVVVGTASDAGLTVELTAMRGGPHLGYVRLGLTVSRGGAAVSDATVSLSATADGGPAAGVALPVETPTRDADAVYRGAAFLLAPDTTARQFTLTATVASSGTTAEVAFPVEARKDLWMQAAGGDVLVSWIDPLRPVVGENRYVVAAHRWTGTAFAAVDGATVELYPYMDMGGGDGHSTPHSGPEALDGGRYGWDVNFIMSGGWEMTVTLSPPGEVDRVATFIGYTVYEPEVEA